MAEQRSELEGYARDPTTTREPLVRKSLWTYLDALLESAELVIDRPKGSSHSRYPSLVYPLDYGYLKGTSGGDGNEVDVWRGTRTPARLDAVVCMADTLKRDVEVKLLVGCSEEEKTVFCDFHNGGEYMAAILVRRGAM